MKTNLKEINSYTRQLDITIGWHLIEADYQNEFNKARSRYSIPGFRKGKVPEKIVKKHLGQSIEANFAEHSINTYYRKALDELQLSPINQTTINEISSFNKTVLKVTDALGRNTDPKPNIPLFYIYDDGTVEKRITIE